MTKRRLFFDIETSFNIGFFWRAGYKQAISPESIITERAIICISWKWEGDSKVYNLRWDRFQCDKNMLEKFMAVLNKADEIIAHNGDRFDIKWLRTRCLKHGIPMFPKYVTLDTLKKAKSGFYFNSNKLDYIAKFLGVGKKMDTGGLDLWKDVILNNSRSALDKMVDYCDQDVRILEKVYNKLKNYVEHNINYATLAGLEPFACPECGSIDVRHRKTYTTRMGTKKHNITCTDCTKNYVVSGKIYTDLLQYRMLHGIK